MKSSRFEGQNERNDFLVTSVKSSCFEGQNEQMNNFDNQDILMINDECLKIMRIILTIKTLKTIDANY